MPVLWLCCTEKTHTLPSFTMGRKEQQERERRKAASSSQSLRSFGFVPTKRSQAPDDVDRPAREKDSRLDSRSSSTAAVLTPISPETQLLQSDSSTSTAVTRSEEADKGSLSFSTRTFGASSSAQVSVLLQSIDFIVNVRLRRTILGNLTQRSKKTLEPQGLVECSTNQSILTNKSNVFVWVSYLFFPFIFLVKQIR